jgi:hypothetical protein
MSINCQIHTRYTDKTLPPCRHPASWRDTQEESLLYNLLLCPYHSNHLNSRVALDGFPFFSDARYLAIQMADMTLEPEQVIDKLYAEWNNMTDAEKKKWESTSK